VIKLFLPESVLEGWLAEEKADLKDGQLVVPAENVSAPAQPAVHFVKLITGKDDQRLLSKVKTKAQLDALGAEAMADSVVLGEEAYEVVPGYVAELPTPAKGADKRKASPEADMLAAFILDKMS
jgi:hypothetical protein